MASPSLNNGQQKASSTLGEFNRVAFVVQQMISRMQTATLVRVEAVTNEGGLSPVGFVDVLPLVNQVDAQGNPTPHATIYNVPYLRMQGGANAIILDPQVGDVGLCAFGSRDLTKIKATKKQGNPGSGRQYSFADALYVGGMLNGTPTQFVRFSPEGIEIKSPVAVVLDAPSVTLQCETLTVNASASVTITTPTFTVNGATVLAGAVSQTGGGVAQFSGTLDATGGVSDNGVRLKTHIHSDPQGGDTGPPT